MRASQKGDKLIVCYLLGDLRGEDERRFEESYFQDDDFYLQLKKVERDLIDRYVRGDLTTRQLENFETHYLSSPSHRERVEFAKALARSFSRSSVRVEEATARESLGWWGSLVDLFRASNRRILLATAMSLAVIGGSVLTVETFRLRDRLAQNEVDRSELEALQRDLERQVAEKQRQSNQSAEELNHSRAELDRLKQELALLRESGSEPTPVIASFLLSPSLVRETGERNRLVIPPGAAKVRLQLSIEEAFYRNYQASLRTVEGAPVWSGKPRISRSGKVVVLTLSAHSLLEEDYILSLHGVTSKGEVEGAGNYYFRVVRK
jgi:hypothetical protein